MVVNHLLGEIAVLRAAGVVSFGSVMRIALWSLSKSIVGRHSGLSNVLLISSLESAMQMSSIVWAGIYVGVPGGYSLAL
ncbi:hypothetical protein PV326_011403 [Microctonus aethiopoides]|nr:hypothetical protein PV326_011403 [Microctonus aethiopoides]